MMQDLKDKVWYQLEMHESISRVSLRALIGIGDDSDRTMRLAIAELRDEGKPIGSCPKRGYFIIQTEEDYDQAVREFVTRGMTYWRRYRQLKKLGEEKFSKQLEIPLEDVG